MVKFCSVWSEICFTELLNLFIFLCIKTSQSKWSYNNQVNPAAAEISAEGAEFVEQSRQKGGRKQLTSKETKERGEKFSPNSAGDKNLWEDPELYDPVCADALRCWSGINEAAGATLRHAEQQISVRNGSTWTAGWSEQTVLENIWSSDVSSESLQFDSGWRRFVLSETNTTNLQGSHSREALTASLMLDHLCLHCWTLDADSWDWFQNTFRSIMKHLNVSVNVS